MLPLNTPDYVGSGVSLATLIVIGLALSFLAVDVDHSCQRAAGLCTSPLETRTVSATACPGAVNNTCIKAYLLPEYDACEKVYAAVNTTCENSCYRTDATSTVCDGNGHCEGDYADCAGTCDDASQCELALPVSAYWDDIYYSTTLLRYTTTVTAYPAIHSKHYECLFNQCQLHILSAYVDSVDPNTVEQSFIPLGAAISCLQYLHPDFVRSHAGCIEQSWDLLDPNITNHLYPVQNYTEGYMQFRMCKLTYACSALNATELALSSTGAVPEASVDAPATVVAAPGESSSFTKRRALPQRTLAPGSTIVAAREKKIRHEMINKAAALVKKLKKRVAQ
jgi:hypothetical protein